jgi:hypothetical protein
VPVGDSVKDGTVAAVFASSAQAAASDMWHYLVPPGSAYALTSVMSFVGICVYIVAMRVIQWRSGGA